MMTIIVEDVILGTLYSLIGTFYHYTFGPKCDGHGEIVMEGDDMH